jgi:hypothetical protein
VLLDNGADAGDDANKFTDYGGDDKMMIGRNRLP